ncbi:MAG: TetR/AcrR family transcriptional regulator [Bacteroidales bacterium]|nr:TetR/AcrR family transcriptional regulator [Bacteroidales bacterium]
MTLNTETEQKIIASAEKLFYQKGKAGTSMQDIADDAGINRTLLNYYFRSKDQLFEAVFRNAMSHFVPNLAAMLHSDMTFRDYVSQMIETIIDTMLENPQIPIFVLQELSSNPDRMPEIIKEMGIDPAVAMNKMESEQRKEFGSLMDPRQVIINILSLCIFPFAARPVVTEILFNGDTDAYIEAMKQRKQLLPLLVDKFMMQNNKP